MTLEGRALAGVVDVLLVGEARARRPASPSSGFERAFRAAWIFSTTYAGIATLISPASSMNFGRDAELACLPREVERVERNAVTAPAGTGVEAHEAERLRRRGIENLPDVDTHPVEHDLQLVDERDVHGTEDVLDQLARLGRPRGRNAHRLHDHLVVKGLRQISRHRIDAADDLRDGRRRETCDCPGPRARERRPGRNRGRSSGREPPGSRGRARPSSRGRCSTRGRRAGRREGGARSVSPCPRRSSCPALSAA